MGNYFPPLLLEPFESMSKIIHIYRVLPSHRRRRGSYFSYACAMRDVLLTSRAEKLPIPPPPPLQRSPPDIIRSSLGPLDLYNRPVKSCTTFGMRKYPNTHFAPRLVILSELLADSWDGLGGIICFIHSPIHCAGLYDPPRPTEADNWGGVKASGEL